MRLLSTYVIDEREAITLTVYDGETPTKTKYNQGDLTGIVSYKEKDGYYFAGFYADADFITPADFSNVTADMTVYAKYIEADSIDLKTSLKTYISGKLTATITVSDADFAEVGLEINGIKQSGVMLNPKNSFARSFFRKYLGADLPETYVVTWNGSFSDVIRMYWITEDGTTVYANV